MHWFILVISAIFEAVWATALGLSEGFSKPVPSIVFLLGLAVSMGLLAVAMRKIPISTAYAIWTGLGAALTVTWAMLTGAEPASAIKVILIAGIVLCVIGLKLAPARPGPRAVAESFRKRS